MPDPAKYKDKQDFMGDCMHQVKKVEGEPQNVAVGKCLGMWRSEHEGKKSSKKRTKGAFEVVRTIAERLNAYA
jgi:hypothetical protein